MIGGRFSAGASLRSSRALRVLMVCARCVPETGGTETHINEVAQRLSASSDFEITILTTDRTRSLPTCEVFEKVTILRVPAWPQNRDYYFAPRIAAVVGQPDRWDLVHCQGIHTPVPIVAMVAARRANIPYLVTFHTGGHASRHRNTLRGLQWRLIGPLLRDAISLVGVSKFEATMISEAARLRGKPVVIIPNGGTLPAPDPGTAVIRGRIVSSGRLERYKGHHRVIEALPHIIREVPEAHLNIIGRGPYEHDLRALAKRLGITDRVKIMYLPSRERKAMATALAQAEVVAALSDYEAHPVAVMEALGVGRPVIGYDTAGISDLVAEGWVHGIVPGASPATTARRFIEAMSVPPSVKPHNLPTWDSCASELGQVYVASAGSQVRTRQLRSGISRPDIFQSIRIWR
jgi:glycosyltransferase involved in cell wall biosynthesis